MLHSRFSKRAPLLVSAIALLTAWGCGGEDDGLGFDLDPDAGADVADPGDGPDGGSGGAGGAGGEDGEDGGGGSGGCTAASDCNDGIGCTVDVCNNGVCSHYAGPNSGATACPAGQYCEAGKGCVPGAPCATTAQCEARFGGDACKTQIHCDPALAVCQFSILDNDGDGHVPVVCGGDDCNDADDGIHGGRAEICDGKDNDCNGVIDDGATCPGAAVCQAGSCVCPAPNQCGGDCVDKSSDPNHCGACNRACPVGMSCQGGSCVCPSTSVTCGGVCVDTGSNRQHCGACNQACKFGQACEDGKCVQAPCTPPALFILQDQSGSMTGEPWSAVQGGIQGFVNQTASSGLNVGITFFPTSINACLASSYETPTVSIGALPGNANAITGSLQRTPNTNSYLTAPLQGTARYVSNWANANPQSKAAIVVVFDGAPNQTCTPEDRIDNAVMAAADANSASPSIKTYAIGIGPEAVGSPLNWNRVASAGGTGSAYIVSSAAEMAAALASIRDKLSTCP